jgi:hypothetical protein
MLSSQYTLLHYATLYITLVRWKNGTEKKRSYRACIYNKINSPILFFDYPFSHAVHTLLFSSFTTRVAVLAGLDILQRLLREA